MADKLQIERAGPGEWQRVRAVRLRALEDAPDAFATTVDDARSRTADSWRERLVDDAAATFLAVMNGIDVGMVVGADLVEHDATAGLFAMWVAPQARRHGVGRALVEAVVAWARSRSRRRVLLEVADSNAPAVMLYERAGFRPTGRSGTLPPPRSHVTEHERALAIGDWINGPHSVD